MQPNIASIKHVYKSFDKSESFALESISTELPNNKIIAIAGPDGAGKSTLIRLMAALLVPTQGSISIDGYDTTKDAARIHECIGYMPQKFGLYEDLTVMQNLTLYADLKGLIKEERSQTFAQLLHFTDLAQFTTRLAKNLSGGMKQKLGLACALIKKPKLLLLDEPTVGVDPISRRELWQMIQHLLQEGITIVWSTSYLDEAEKCDLVLLLNEGKLLYQGKPSDLTNTEHLQTFIITNVHQNRRSVLAQLLDIKGVIDGVIQGSNIRVVLKDTSVYKSLSTSYTLSSTPPRFEDAFVSILGGSTKGPSKLASTTPKITPSQEGVIIADSLTKQFGSFTAAHNISFSVRSGEIFGLLGPNGAGKSTTFKMLCGLLRPTQGRASILGKDLQQMGSRARAHIGYMAQKFSLYDNLSVLQNLEFFSGIYNLVGRKKQEAIAQMIDIFNLKEYLNETSDLLPLGYKQRLALSCAVMHRPEVLFLDEPTSGVDPLTRREFWSHINGLVEQGVTVMVTTHFMDEAEYCDRIALIYRGQMIKEGSPDDLKMQAISANCKNPTLEDAFIHVIEQYNKEMSTDETS